MLCWTSFLFCSFWSREHFLSKFCSPILSHHQVYTTMCCISFRLKLFFSSWKNSNQFCGRFLESQQTKVFGSLQNLWNVSWFLTNSKLVQFCNFSFDCNLYFREVTLRTLFHSSKDNQNETKITFKIPQKIVSNSLKKSQRMLKLYFLRWETSDLPIPSTNELIYKAIRHDEDPT